jgi:hypothetical protein
LNVVVAARNAAHDAAVAAKSNETMKLTDFDEEMAAEKKDFRDKSAGEITDWPKKCKELYKAFYKAQYAALQAQYNETESSKIPVWGDLWNAYYEYRQEHYLKAAGYLCLAVLDAWGVFAITKGAFAAGRYAASRVSSRIASRAAAEETIERAGSSGGRYAAQILDGGSGRALAGHGEYRLGSGVIVVPEGSSITLPAEGKGISDAVAQFIERGDWNGLFRAAKTNARIAADVEGMATYLPGAKIPNYTLTAPNRLAIYSKSITVEDPTLLSDLINTYPGHIDWAACTIWR